MTVCNNNAGNSRCNPCKNDVTYDAVNCGDRAVIEVSRVWSGCCNRLTRDIYMVEFVLPTSPAPTLPLTYRAMFSSGAPSTISNLIITKQPNCKKAKIEYDVTVPVTLSYVDANNIPGQVDTTLTAKECYCMDIPKARTPYVVESDAVVASDSGAFISSTKATVKACVVVETRTVTKSALVIPYYGEFSLPVNQPQIIDNCALLIENRNCNK